MVCKVKVDGMLIVKSLMVRFVEVKERSVFISVGRSYQRHNTTDDSSINSVLLLYVCTFVILLV